MSLVSINTVLFEEGMLQENTITNKSKAMFAGLRGERKKSHEMGWWETNANRNYTKTSFNIYPTEKIAAITEKCSD